MKCNKQLHLTTTWKVKGQCKLFHQFVSYDVLKGDSQFHMFCVSDTITFIFRQESGLLCCVNSYSLQLSFYLEGVLTLEWQFLCVAHCLNQHENMVYWQMSFEYDISMALEVVFLKQAFYKSWDYLSSADCRPHFSQISVLLLEVFKTFAPCCTLFQP